MASSKQRSSLSSLPPELIEEILCRTPAESLIRLESTCKQWYARITDERFIYNHLHRSPERFIRTVDETVQIMDPVTGTSSAYPIPNAFQPPYEIHTMVHCDGLMLCVCGDWSVGLGDVRLAIWNPVLRKIRWIDPSKCLKSFYFYGIGYDNKPRDGYKILRFYDRRYGSFDGEAEAEIYELKTNSWKTLDTKVDWDVGDWCKGVAVMGNMYWIARNEKHKDDEFIMGFDFSDETFKDICLCPPSSWDSYLGCFNGDRLSWLKQDRESPQIEVWVSNKLADGNVSFSKYFSVARPDLPVLRYHTGLDNPVYCFGKHKSIIAWCKGRGEADMFYYPCLTLYEIDEDGLRKQIETQRDYKCGYGASFFCGYVYVPSLISPEACFVF